MIFDKRIIDKQTELNIYSIIFTISETFSILLVLSSSYYFYSLLKAIGNLQLLVQYLF